MHEKLVELSLLEKNWDSYGGKPMTRLALQQAELLLRCFAAIDAVEPFVIPTSGGGIQLEWHTGGYDLEMEILDSGIVGEVYTTRYNEKTNA